MELDTVLATVMLDCDLKKEKDYKAYVLNIEQVCSPELAM